MSEGMRKAVKQSDATIIWEYAWCTSISPSRVARAGLSSTRRSSFKVGGSSHILSISAWHCMPVERTWTLMCPSRSTPGILHGSSKPSYRETHQPRVYHCSWQWSHSNWSARLIHEQLHLFSLPSFFLLLQYTVTFSHWRSQPGHKHADTHSSCCCSKGS